MEIFTIETIFVYLSSNVTRSWNIIKICIKVKRHTHTLSLSLIFTRITDRFIPLSSEGVIRKKAERLIAVGTQWHTFAYTYAFRTVQRFNSHELVPLLYSPISPRPGFYPRSQAARKLILRHLCYYWRSAGKKGSTLSSRSHFVAHSRFNCVSMFQKVYETLAPPVHHTAHLLATKMLHNLVAFCPDTIQYPVDNIVVGKMHFIEYIVLNIDQIFNLHDT